MLSFEEDDTKADKKASKKRSLYDLTAEGQSIWREKLKVRWKSPEAVIRSLQLTVLMKDSEGSSRQ